MKLLISTFITILAYFQSIQDYLLNLTTFNYLEPQTYPDTLASNLGLGSMGMEPNGTVVYKQCPDDLKVFKLDYDKTTNSPDPVTKGTNISFNLAGTLEKPLNITSVNVHVDYLTTVYYDKTTQLNNTYSPSAVNFLEKWTLDSDAPPGTYDITFTFFGVLDDDG